MRPFIHPSRTVEPPMSSIAYQDQTRAIVARLEQREVARAGSVAAARSTLARKLGALPGTLETLARGRLKRIDGWLRVRAETLLFKEIEHEIAALECELACLRATGADPRLSAVGEIEKALETARRLMERQS